MHPALLALAVGFTYLLAAELGLQLILRPEGLAAAWPAAGIGAAALTIGWHARAWLVPALLLANVVSNLLHDQGIGAAGVFALANVGESVLFAWLLRRALDREFAFDSLRSAFAFGAAALVAATAAAVLGSVALVAIGHMQGSLLRAVPVWLLSDVVGIVTIAPAVLAWASPEARRLRPWNLAEGVAGLGVLGLICAWMFDTFVGDGNPWSTMAAAALIFGVVLLMTVRLPPAFAATALPLVLLFAVLAVEERALGLDAASLARVVGLQVFALLLAVCALTLTALIRQRARAEDDLRDSRTRLELSLDAARMGVVELDWTSGGFVATERALEMHGHAPGARLDLARAVANVHPADRARIAAIVENVARRGGSAQFEYRTVHADGTERWIASSVRGLPGAEGLPSGRAIGTVRDVTDRRAAEQALRESEARFRAAVENFPHGFVVYDAERRFQYLNAWALQLLGLPLERFLGRRDEDLWPRELTREYLPTLERVLRERALQSFEWTLPAQFGTRTLLVTYVPLLDESGRLANVLAITFDLTERKRAEAALQEADRRKDEFLATLAHELRNPLAPIRSGLRVMRLANGDLALIDEVRGVMERQVNHLVHLVDDLLDVSRITRGKLELRRERIVLAAAVEAALETVRPAVAAQGHALDVRLPEAPVYLDADLTRLAQVFANLLSNAAKYTPPGGRIELRASCADGRVRIEVEDDGIGIEAAELEKVFDMFAQLEPGADQAAGGLGIGLSLVRALVAMHGGTVAAASEGRGRGTTVTVVLPTVPADECSASTAREAPADAVADVLASSPSPSHRPSPVPAPAPAPAPAQPVAPSARPGGARGASERVAPDGRGARRVLVVDDNADAADSLALLLTMLGHEVRIARDGPQALGIAARERPEVVLMDLGMPGMDGLETTRRLRAEPWGRDVLVIALTGWGQPNDRAASRAAGCDAHLVKPIDPDELEALLAAGALRPAERSGATG